MGYFPGYDMEPCWFCGKTDCNGNHQGPEAEAASRRITHHNQEGSAQNCPCENCKSRREREANRRNR
jgi:hypothetical protein